MRKAIVFSLILLATMQIGAWERTDAELQRVASETLKNRTGLTLSSSKIKKLIDKGNVSVYAGEEKGYVVLSRSSASSPVIGYSDQILDINMIPDGLTWWLDQADRSISAREGLMPATSEAPVVAPMLTTAWAQERPFNNLCPSTGGFWGSTPQTGCVATAMAQIMKYYNYPAQGKGKGQYSTDGQTFSTVSIKTKYDWANMRDRYSFNYSETEANAVAELMRDCGYASSMIYTDQGSGTNLYEAAHGLAINMQYDSLSLKVMTRDYYRDDEWVKAIRDEMAANRPILYTGVDLERMGHAFVFDGMDNRGFVHVNWGWSGTANGYFDISTLSGLTPSYPDPYSGTDIKYDFCDQQVMVLGFNPSATPAADAKYESFFASYALPKLSFKDDSLLIDPVPVFNFSHLDFKGLLGLVIQGEDGHAVVQPFFYSGWEGGAVIPITGGIYMTEEYYPSATLNDADGTTPRPDGVYQFYFVSWSEQEMAQKTNPQMILYPVSLAKEGAPKYGLWEARKVNGHWDPSSLHLVDTPAGIEEININNNTDAQLQDAVYTLDGVMIGTDLNESATVIKGTPVIVRKDGRTFKTIAK